MEYPADLKYTKDHEWIRVEDGVATVGITEFAQEELGEIVFVELPEVGDSIEKGQTFCVVESTKAASDVYAPIAGTVVEGNEALADAPEAVNNDAYGEGWLLKMTPADADAMSGLMDASEYQAFVESE